MNSHLLQRARRFAGTTLAVMSIGLMVAGAASAQRDNDRDHDRDRDRNNNHRMSRNDRDGQHWRFKHGGYVTDQRGADLLRAAVNNGYQQGYQAGLDDRNGRRRNNWRRNQYYMSGNMGYESYVDQSQYRYYFQQGFQRGYDDAFYNRNRYGRDNTILGNVLDTILGVSRW